MNLRITDLLDDYMDDQIPVDPIPVPDTKRIKEAAMKKINRRSVRPLRIVLIAAAVVVLLTGTVLGIYAARNWEAVLSEFLHAEDADKEMMDSALQDVYVSKEKNGYTYTVKQVLGDNHCMMVALEIKLPDDLEFGTISKEQLKALAESNGYEWQNDGTDDMSVMERLSGDYGFDERQNEFPARAPSISWAHFFPINVSEEEVMTVFEEERAAYPDHQFYTYSELYRKALEELPEAANGVGSGGLVQRFDPETKTITILLDTTCGGILQGRDCTLIIDDLYLEDFQQTYSTPAEKYQINISKTQLQDEPVVLNFTADYEVQSELYDIFEDGTKVGTLELSPISAYLTFPMEPDETAYSSLEAAALAKKRKDYLGLFPELSIVLQDGTVIPLRARTSGIAEMQTGTFISEDVLDLEQVKDIILEGYTFEKRK